MMKNAPCWMCGFGLPVNTFALREMMYGTRELFEYHECQNCGSLQIVAVPSDLTNYYPTTYYSFRKTARQFKSSFLRNFFRKKRANYRISGKGLIGRLINPKSDKDWFARQYTWRWFQVTSSTADSRILDVGCGAGALLYSLRDQGFDRLTGVDPFLGAATNEPGIKLLNCTIHDLDGEYDLVMAHHSLEHMSDPGAALVKMRDLCRVGGWIVLRLPVLGDSWGRYGSSWVELDAPRHLFIPSLEGLHALISRIDGLDIAKVEFDTFLFEIAGSELYLKNIPLRTLPSGAEVNLSDHFTPEELASFNASAKALNEAGTAGRAVIYVSRTR